MKQWQRILFVTMFLFLFLLPANSAHAIGPYQKNLFGTVLDDGTGLEWQHSDDGTLRTWESALAYCEGLTLSYYDDWRLPSRRELSSIVDFSSYFPAIDGVFSSRPEYYWSATTYAYSTSRAWILGFYSGSVAGSKKTTNLYVRCVRAGLSSGTFDLSIILDGSGSGAVNINQPDETCTINCAMGFLPGSTVTLTALAGSGSIFTGWSGDCSGTGLIITVTMDSAKICTAAFSKAGDWNPLPDTGQTTCYDGGGTVIDPCPVPGESFYGQDTNYSDSALAYLDHGNGTVTDTNTGLMWQQNTADTDISGNINSSDLINWQDALDYCANLSYEGDDDWRLPSRFELRSIADYGSIHPVFTCQSSSYWSDRTYANITSSAWYLHFYNGYDSAHYKSNSYYVRCVRAGL